MQHRLALIGDALVQLGERQPRVRPSVAALHLALESALATLHPAKVGLEFLVGREDRPVR